MITLKSAIYVALTGDKALEGVDIYAEKAPAGSKYPRVTYFEVTNYDARFADDKTYVVMLIYQIDVWSRTNPDPIAVEVDRIMKTIGFVAHNRIDLYEDDTKIYHRALRYRIVKEV